ncbi:oxygenase MpaB family protein [Demequina zhanjiangensis]|uniref:Oxygenase MpaB family protein n=1 Tax=Demequina zhanjiangensis TaxID=3051659 RepID=A0ABT8G026_9MICO|nr:oxygenase MpaB family protein [Demequina sp. SYSU T00b26]MDN4472069.1 oxygenase MpaB family protein [Demequina sp. SYSU T00b26]
MATLKAERRQELDALDTSALREGANWFISFAGTANVIWQLSRPPVAYGVMESKGPGALFHDPKRRMRTTIGYIAVTMLGSADDRAAYRAATNQSHAPVKSEPGAKVPYRAFDPTLQIWVAACLYRGAENAYEFVHGPLAGEFREEFYRQGMVFGTTLQMPPEDWPATRDEFETWWDKAAADLEIDDTARDYLWRVLRLEYLGRDVPERLLRWRIRMTAGYLGPRFRDMMRIEWDDEEQRRYDRFNRRMAAFQRAVPRAVREAPLRRPLRGIRKRIAAGQPLF